MQLQQVISDAQFMHTATEYSREPESTASPVDHQLLFRQERSRRRAFRGAPFPAFHTLPYP